MNRLIASSLILLACNAVAFSEETVRRIGWEELRQAGQLLSGEIQQGEPSEPGPFLKIDNPAGTARVVPLLVVDDPAITKSRYALSGKVRYDDVEGQTYLEMWNEFPDGSHYFSRTLASFGPMRHLGGSSPWREFSLPFYMKDDSNPPSKLTVNVVFPGPGTVYLGPLRLVQYDDDENPLAVRDAWWNDRTAGMIGGTLGAVIGCLGALIGTLAGMGRARRFVLTLTGLIFLFGLAALVLGLTGVICRQPYCVWYPPLLLGAICIPVMGGAWLAIRRRYQQYEFRKIAAMDA